MKRNIIAIISVILTCIYPVLFLYFINADEVSFKETLLPAIVFLLVGLSCTLLTSFIFKSVVKGSIGGILLCFLFSNYALIEHGFHQILPQLKYWHIMPILLIIVLHIIYLICSKLKEEILPWFNIFISIFMGGLIALNLVLAVPDIIEKSSVKIDKTDVSDVKVQSREVMPNVYYLIFDEYSGFDVIKKYYNYDNSDFANFLTDKGFTVSIDSYNESYSTETVLPNLVNYEYVVNDNMSSAEKKAYRYNGKLFDLMESNGYEVKAAGAANAFNMKSMTENKAARAKSIGGMSYFDLLINNTMGYPLIQKNSYVRAQEIWDAFSYFQNKKIYDQRQEFTMFYLMLPHQPFIFDENGGERSSNDFNNWKDKKFYLGQFIYTTKLIREQIETIIKNDPDCIIILQSDHSARALVGEASELAIKVKDRENILNAVYYRGENFDEIKSQSGVNTVRLTLNRLFKLDLPLLEVPINEKDMSEK